MKRGFFYLLPLIAWAVLVNVLFQPRNISEFFFVGHWFLIPLAAVYLLWIPLVRWLVKKDQ